VRISVGLTGSAEQRWAQLEESWRQVSQAPPSAKPAFKAAQVSLIPGWGLLVQLVGVCAPHQGMPCLRHDMLAVPALATYSCAPSLWPLAPPLPCQVVRDVKTGELKRTPSWHSFGTLYAGEEDEDVDEGSSEGEQEVTAALPPAAVSQPAGASEGGVWCREEGRGRGAGRGWDGVGSRRSPKCGGLATSPLHCWPRLFTITPAAAAQGPPHLSQQASIKLLPPQHNNNNFQTRPGHWS